MGRSARERLAVGPDRVIRRVASTMHSCFPHYPVPLNSSRRLALFGMLPPFSERKVSVSHPAKYGITCKIYSFVSHGQMQSQNFEDLSSYIFVVRESDTRLRKFKLNFRCTVAATWPTKKHEGRRRSKH